MVEEDPHVPLRALIESRAGTLVESQTLCKLASKVRRMKEYDPERALN